MRGITRPEIIRAAHAAAVNTVIAVLVTFAVQPTRNAEIRVAATVTPTASRLTVGPGSVVRRARHSAIRPATMHKRSAKIAVHRGNTVAPAWRRAASRSRNTEL